MNTIEALAALRQAAAQEFATDWPVILAAIDEALSQADSDATRLDDACGRLYAVQSRLSRAWERGEAAARLLENARENAEKVAIELEGLCSELKTLPVKDAP